MADTLIENVSDTAFWIAHHRAIETQRPDALFRDPLAGVLAGERGKNIAETMPTSFMTGWAVVIRTCIIDDYIRLALAEGVDTVLNLGAGLDTRPYRMDLPSSLLWIEADYPHMIEFKKERLSQETPRCRLERVSVDLTNRVERHRLFEQANARAKKIFVLSEGVTPYLSPEEVASLAEDLKAMDRVCYWVVDYFAPEMIKFRQGRLRQKMQNAPFKFAPKDWFSFFQERGWRVKEIRYLSAEGERLGRKLEVPLRVKLLFLPRALFASPEQRARFKKMVGYVLLEPESARQ